jgi:hypothetical protein
LEILEYPWEIVGIYNVTNLPKTGLYGYTPICIMICQLTKMVHFVPFHKEINEEESTYLFTSNCYSLHGVPKAIAFDRYHRFVGKCWQSLMGKLNTKSNMNTARHPLADGLIERVNQTMYLLLRCYCAESGFEWISHLSMVEFYYNCSINEATAHSLFEAMYDR